jgi:hypothetical protein
MSMLKEFRDFAVKGNVIDLAVGIIIGAAFGKIVDSLVNDVVMPAINAMVGGAVDFTNQYVVLSGSVPTGTPLAAARTSAVPVSLPPLFPLSGRSFPPSGPRRPALRLRRISRGWRPAKCLRSSGVAVRYGF